MKTTKPPKTKKEQVDEINLFMNSEVGKDFRSWWKDHRHSGYATRPGTTYERWSTQPYTAWMCDRYRAEYASDRGILAHLNFEYSAEDYERWAREQKEANEAVAAFAASHGGREIPTEAEFMATLRKSLQKLRSKLQAPSAPPKEKTQAQIHNELHAAAVRRPFTPAK